MTQRGKVALVLAALMLALAMMACGDFNETSPMLNSIEHTVSEAN